MTAVKGNSMGIGMNVGGQSTRSRWTRDLPWWHWRYWFGARWRHHLTLYYKDMDRTHYATDKQRARQALAEQFDPARQGYATQAPPEGSTTTAELTR